MKEKVNKMSGQFNGFFENAVHNQRVIIPAAFKRKFAEEARKTVVITSGPLNSIALFPLDSWHWFLEKLENGSEQDRNLRAQLIHGTVAEQELEGPGRIRIPELMLKEANITDSVIVKGELHYISLWNPDEFYAHRSAMLEEHRKKFTTVHYY